jgi:hypothetical protein
MSVVGGSLGATARACGDGRWDVSTADVEVRLQRETLPQAHHDERRTDVHIDPVEPVTMWEEGDAVYYLAPVLVCKRPTRTVRIPSLHVVSCQLCVCVCRVVSCIVCRVCRRAAAR